MSAMAAAVLLIQFKKICLFNAGGSLRLAFKITRLLYAALRLGFFLVLRRARYVFLKKYFYALWSVSCHPTLNPSFARPDFETYLAVF
jgi:hypothetical protein